MSILREQKVHNQEELQAKLRETGVEVTQATLSRDLKFLGIARVPDTKEGYIYSVKPVSQPTPRSFLRDDIVRGLKKIDFSGNIAVIKTKLGHATGVAYAIDQLELSEVVGTVGGEDTLFVALREGTDRELFIQALTGEDLDE